MLPQRHVNVQKNLPKSPGMRPKLTSGWVRRWNGLSAQTAEKPPHDHVTYPPSNSGQLNLAFVVNQLRTNKLQSLHVRFKGLRANDSIVETKKDNWQGPVSDTE